MHQTHLIVLWPSTLSIKMHCGVCEDLMHSCWIREAGYKPDVAEGLGFDAAVPDCVCEPTSECRDVLPAAKDGLTVVNELE